MNKQSEEIIKETFALYETKEGKVPETLHGRTILHLYPAEDTIDEDGSLNGYYQNLFFNLVVFNISGSHKRRWNVGKRDGVFTGGCKVASITVFKDGAFCVCIDGDINFYDAQAPTVCPIL